nr:Rieske 2Fe-2S domain-containing protein [Mesorhizobium sp.]
MEDGMSEAPIARWQPVRAEGENGQFSQSWFPVALSTEVAMGQVIGRDFLDGRIVIFRGDDGAVRVMSAYCPHVGADLSVGQVIGDRIQCAFHHWEYDVTGKCVKTGIGDLPPKRACLFVFPSTERFGIIWAFNGEKPLFELPGLPYPDSDLLMSTYKADEPLNCDPWVFAANTPDMQHLKVVHKVKFEVEDPHDLVKWHDFGLEFSYSGVHQGDVPMKNTAGIRGTSVFYRWGQYGSFWRAGVAGFGLPRPGQHEVYACQAVLRGPGAEENLAETIRVSRRTVLEDKDILNTIRYRQGVMTRGDTSLSRFLRYVREYPCAHPSAHFIK